MVEDGVGELGWGFFRGWGRGDETNYCPFDMGSGGGGGGKRGGGERVRN